MSAPEFRTAVPKRRYKLGDYDATILGEVETRDEHCYLYILAMMAMGDSSPVLFMTVEDAPAAEREAGRYRMTARTADDARILGGSDRWKDIDLFAEDALPVAARLLGVDSSAEAMRIL